MSYPGSNVRVAQYDGSMFGGTRAHQDLAVFERLHDYPGVATAYDTESYGFDTGGVVGTATHVPNTGSIRLALSDATVSKKARLRSHDIIRYQPGCMPIVQMTGVSSSNAGMILKCIRRTSTSGVPVDNVEATIAGIDAATENRYELRYAYLGVQGVQYYVNGNLVQNSILAGTLTVPFMKTPHLPISVEIQTLVDGSQVIRLGVFDDSDGLFFEWSRAVGSAAAFSYDYKCSSGRLIGGSVYPFHTYGMTRATTGTGAAMIPLFSIRPKATLNGIPSRVQIFPTQVSFFSESQPGALAIIMNTTLTGPTWVSASPSPAVEVDVAATLVAGGTTLWQVGQGANQQYTYDLSKLFTLIGIKLRHQAFTGTEDILTFAVQREGAVNFDPRVTVTWDELR